MKDKKHHIIILIDAEKISQNSMSLLAKSPEETRSKRDIPQHNKVYTKSLLPNIILNGEKLKAFPLKSEMRLS
jgi:hypothetical protein